MVSKFCVLVLICVSVFMAIRDCGYSAEQPGHSRHGQHGAAQRRCDRQERKLHHGPASPKISPSMKMAFWRSRNLCGRK